MVLHPQEGVTFDERRREPLHRHQNHQKATPADYVARGATRPDQRTNEATLYYRLDCRLGEQLYQFVAKDYQLLQEAVGGWQRNDPVDKQDQHHLSSAGANPAMSHHLRHRPQPVRTRMGREGDDRRRLYRLLLKVDGVGHLLGLYQQFHQCNGDCPKGSQVQVGVCTIFAGQVLV